MEAFSVVAVLAFLAYLYYLDKKPKCKHEDAAASRAYIKNFEADMQLEKEYEEMGWSPPLLDDDKPQLVKCDKCGEKFWYN